MSATATPHTRVCNLLGRAIAELQRQLHEKEVALAMAKSHLRDLQHQRPPDPEKIRLAKAEVKRLESEVETDRAQLQAFQEEFSAECRP
jgi:chromosome segregation ATPase